MEVVINITILIIVLCTLFVLLRPKRDWYIVENRLCSDQKLSQVAFGVGGCGGFDDTSARAHGMTIKKLSAGAVALNHADGGEIVIGQTAFENIQAAILFFETEKLKIKTAPYRKIYLIRVVARSRSNILTLPPQVIWGKHGAILMSYQDDQL